MIDNIGDWKRTHYSKDVTSKMDNKEVIVMGWARALRGGGALKFIQLSDREGNIQITAKKGVVADNIMKKIESLNREDVLAVKGTVKASKEAPNGFEIIPIDIRVLNKAETPLPLELVTKKTPAEPATRFDARSLDLRKPEIAAIFNIKDSVTTAVRNYLEGSGFIEIHSPKIIAEASEGGSEVFKVKYFDREAYLAQSPQFYKQMMMAAGFDRVYEMGPAFRAEKSHTTRHLAEILMLDMEMSFIKSTEDVMDVVEKLMIEICSHVKKNEERSLQIIGKKIEVPKPSFPRITMEEAKKILKKKGLEYKPNEEIDSAGEKALGEYVKEKYDHDFVFLTEFPWAEAKFYHKQSDTNPKAAERCDLIYRGSEIATITQREHRYDILIKQVKAQKVTAEKIKFYLDAFRYGMPPHGGCGIGIDRIVQQLLELSNVQEAVLFPRTSERITP
ncbi:MAG: aspartate--tRNA(Asn) ligase [Candidatus Aenigmarchaeota archaeon]|nr:aspartate--tRNA(Asn) ligase [Candidatus Aenigmarchaeota archaeon]